MKFKNIFKNDRFNSKKIISYLILLMVIGLSIGYSAFSSSINLEGIVAEVRIKKNVRVTGVSVQYMPPADNLICELQSGTALTRGSQYTCHLDIDRTFYMLGENNDETINLILERNICSDGSYATADNLCTVAWITAADYTLAGGTSPLSMGNGVGMDKGPVTAMNYLNQATSSWTNITYDYPNYNDEGGKFTNFVVTGHARLPYKSEIQQFAIDGSNRFLYDYLAQSSFMTAASSYPIQTNAISGLSGYWLFSSDSSNGMSAYMPYASIAPSNGGSMSLAINFSASATNTTSYGVRPVITVSKSMISSSTYNYDGTASELEYNVNSISSRITLPDSDSRIKFIIEVTNIGNAEVGILDVTGLPSNLDYELDVEKQKICNNNECKLGITKEIELIIGYKDGYYDSNNITFDINPVLNFGQFYNVTYENIRGRYQSEIIGGDTLEVDFGANAPNEVEVTIGNTTLIKDTDYTYTNGVITIPNVDGDIEITNNSPSYICELQLGTALTTGSQYTCHLDIDRTFYVLGQNGDGTINLILERNICSNGSYATADNRCTVAWITAADYTLAGGTSASMMGNGAGVDKGPVTAMNYLNQATSSWTNITYDYPNYNDEGGKFTDFEITGHARLPYKSEIQQFAIDGSNRFLYDYLAQSSFMTAASSYPIQTNAISGLSGYWVFSSDSSNAMSAYMPYASIVPSNGGQMAGSGTVSATNFSTTATNTTSYGVRPVITVSQSDMN